MGQIHLFCTSQVFNSTTNTFGVGTLPPPGAANLQGGIPGTPAQRSDNMMPAGVCGPFGVDTPIYWTAAFTGPYARRRPAHVLDRLPARPWITEKTSWP